MGAKKFLPYVFQIGQFCAEEAFAEGCCASHLTSLSLSVPTWEMSEHLNSQGGDSAEAKCYAWYHKRIGPVHVALTILLKLRTCWNYQDTENIITEALFSSNSVAPYFFAGQLPHCLKL